MDKVTARHAMVRISWRRRVRRASAALVDLALAVADTANPWYATRVPERATAREAATFRACYLAALLLVVFLFMWSVVVGQPIIALVLAVAVGILSSV